MLRSDACFTLFAALTIIGITGEYTIYNNGWIPVSPDKVYDQIRKDLLYTSNQQNQNGLDLTTGTYYDLVQHDSQKEDREDISDDEYQFDNQHNLEPVTFQQETSWDEEQQTVNHKETARQAKYIAEYIIEKKVSVISKNNQEIFNEKYNNEEISTIKGTKFNYLGNLLKSNTTIEFDDLTTESASTNIYEVTEDEQTETSNASQYIGYQYNSPLNQNLTSKLFDILSKYNISPNDTLENYALSRQYKGLIPSKQTMQDLRNIPYSYNSPNHLPINPLHAVFLSNYGVYLPDLYGIKGNYKNLYGYLAYNNIHNNKPFGLYKIYSDTDSSN